MRDERGLPVLDAEGRISIESVNSLSFAQIRQWIGEFLRGKDPSAGGNRLHLPHGFLSDVYRELDPPVRECFQDAALYYLGEFAGGALDWEEEELDELLLLVTELFRNSWRTQDPVEVIRFMLEQDSSNARTSLNLRTAQVLVGLRYRAEPEFWLSLFGRYGKDYALVVFEGISLSSVTRAVEWIRTLEHEQISDVMINSLPLLVEEHGADRLSSLITDLLGILHEPHKSAVYVLAERLGLMPPNPTTIADWRVLIEKGIRNELLMESGEVSLATYIAAIVSRSSAADTQSDFVTQAVLGIVDTWDLEDLFQTQRYNRLLELIAQYPSAELFNGLVKFVERASTKYGSHPDALEKALDVLISLYADSSHGGPQRIAINTAESIREKDEQVRRQVYVRALKRCLAVAFSQKVWEHLVQSADKEEVAEMTMAHLEKDEVIWSTIVAGLRARASVDQRVELTLTLLVMVQEGTGSISDAVRQRLIDLTFDLIEEVDLPSDARQELERQILIFSAQPDYLRPEFEAMVARV